MRLIIAKPKKSIDKITEAIKSHFSAPRLVEKILPSPPKAAESAELLCWSKIVITNNIEAII